MAKEKYKPDLKSDKSWAGKNILTGAKAERPHGTQPPGWKHMESTIEANGQHVVYCDGEEIARWPKIAE